MVGDEVIISTKTGDKIGHVVQIGYPKTGYITVRHDSGIHVAPASDVKQTIRAYDGPMGIFEDYEEVQKPSLEDLAHVAGYDAYLDGASNPYADYPHLAKAWQEGFEHARQDEMNNEPVF